MRRRLLYLISGLGLLIVACIVYMLLRPCNLCEARKVIASRMGVEPTFLEMNKYLDQQMSIGQSKVDINALLENIKPDKSERAPEMSFEHEAPNGECFRMRFDITLYGDLNLNRYLCFDGSGKLFYSVQELALS